MEQEGAWQKTADLDVYLSSVTKDPVNNILYVVDSTTDAWSMHKVDPATGKSVDTAANGAGVPLWDLVYSQRFSTAEAPLVSGIYYYYFLVPENPMKLSGAAFPVKSSMVRQTSSGAYWSRLDRLSSWLFLEAAHSSSRARSPARCCPSPGSRAFRASKYKSL